MRHYTNDNHAAGSLAVTSSPVVSLCGCSGAAVVAGGIALSFGVPLPAPLTGLGGLTFHTVAGSLFYLAVLLLSLKLLVVSRKRLVVDVAGVCVSGWRYQRRVEWKDVCTVHLRPHYGSVTLVSSEGEITVDHYFSRFWEVKELIKEHWAAEVRRRSP